MYEWPVFSGWGRPERRAPAAAVLVIDALGSCVTGLLDVSGLIYERQAGRD
ncbi:MAG: hypothetical protein AVDCRST_MAG67-3519 [uncultured Solirubrobacteraceae bacterium]|uniref:Uncharacterized protein n=1 Tax=uncultured Solirubrobacteraceae bacterium TaxID=1162706 RepID=A0A6J4TIA8_9ACTN|nr:MAG: hypothetical protein AVDCRST_MAG67-3519 [uncultured Solirubrobacteraceae bacterium]